MPNPETGVTVIEQSTTDAMVEWSLDDFPTSDFNRLVPTQTLMLPTDLLRPVVQIVQLNPDPKAGDVYSSKDMPEGHSAPTRVGLRKFATAAGISVIDEHRVDDGRDPDVIEMICTGEMLMPTGQRIRATGTKRVDLNAQVWRSPEHRGKFKSFFQEHVASRAQNRMIRALLSLRGSYPAQVYSKPFAVVSFAPNMAHPEVRARILDAMAGASQQLYGGQAPAAQIGPGSTIDVTPAPEEDPAPETPTVLPGEKLARAVTADLDTFGHAPLVESLVGGPKPCLVDGCTALAGFSAEARTLVHFPAVAATDDPDWITGAPAPAATEAQAEPAKLDVVDKLRQVAEKSKLKGEATEPQRERIKSLLGGGQLEPGQFGAVIVAAFGEASAKAPTAAQAHAIVTLADSFGGDIDAFLEAWRATAAAVKGEAAA